MLDIKDFNKSKIKDYIDENGILYIGIDATHAGIVNFNNFLYLPKGMKDGIDSFFKPYSKPILKHHAEHEDSIGYICDATFLPLKNNELLNENLTTEGQIGLARTYIKSIGQQNMHNVKEYALGVSHIIAAVASEEDIDKIADKRLNTVSIGASTTDVYCSICGEKFGDPDSDCDHYPGSVYDGEKCFFIAGELSFEEVSFVNVPADPLAKITCIYSKDEIKQFSKERINMSDKKNDTTKIKDSKNTDSKDIAKLESEIATLKSEKTELEDKVNVLDVEKSTLQSELDKAKKNLEDKEKECNSLKELNDSLNKEVKDTYLTKLTKVLIDSGRDVSEESVKENFGDKSLSAIKDYINVLTFGQNKADTTKDNKNPKDDKSEDKSDSKGGDQNLKDSKNIDNLDSVDTGNSSEGKSNIKHLSDQERFAFYSLLNRYGKDAAQSFLDGLKTKSGD